METYRSTSAETPDEGGGQCTKIAFVGSHGVGKTTLCFELAAQLKRLDYRVELVKEVARRCPLPINKESTLDAQAWILHTQVAMEIEAANGHDAVVCDRSVLDNYAYLVAACGRQKALDPMVEAWLATYDHLVWVPILEGPRYDGTRDTDRAYQRQIDSVLGDLVETFGASPLRLHGIERTGWMDEVLTLFRDRPMQLPLFGDDV